MLEIVLVDVFHGRSSILTAMHTILRMSLVMLEQRGFLAVSIRQKMVENEKKEANGMKQNKRSSSSKKKADKVKPDGSAK